MLKRMEEGYGKTSSPSNSAAPSFLGVVCFPSGTDGLQRTRALSGITEGVHVLLVITWKASVHQISDFATNSLNERNK